MARDGNWVDCIRDTLDKHIDLENMWEIWCAYYFTFY